MIAIFVDGDFWHGYNWKVLGKIPPIGFWQDKINRNISRDKKYTEEMEGEDWTVIRLWEHEIKEVLPSCLNKIKYVTQDKQ